eukprot:TRINITY_DN21586_c0_g1_i1.p1 TRINITY_DN21586_c0_g1~~TRINITY_DN21586_c0_g1_i1.p1  ORF type:complete len:102 (+),score=33.58 TRINITY_DN21586_c0_g1_i1:40-306(+)
MDRYREQTPDTATLDKRTLYILDGDRNEARKHTVSWYGADVPADDIRKTIAITIGLDPTLPFVLEDEEGHSIVVSSRLPSGLRLRICY